MDTDLIKSLEQLEIEKKILNQNADLTKEYEAIIELDHRLTQLLERIRTINGTVHENYAFVMEKCDKLSPLNLALKKLNRISDLSNQLAKLNQLCKRIDNNHIFKSLLVGRRPSLRRDDSEESEQEARLQLTRDLIESFEAAYKPVEAILSSRSDLPYISYANRVRQLKSSLANELPVQASDGNGCINDAPAGKR